ncbi:thiamine biosynthesis protein ThiS [methanogenic archaeon mixed culture ISO4-G1]|nr:thiamine biosynthesis protein ThiS [methanogenic archaeon mixed culture ISO4-G1]
MDCLSSDDIMVTVKVNGSERSYPDGTTVSGMLLSEGMDPKKVAVEIEMDIVPRRTFDDREIRNGETIEIVSFVGGG